jgi:tetratricopeptide (TPR) repeat protein
MCYRLGGMRVIRCGVLALAAAVTAAAFAQQAKAPASPAPAASTAPAANIQIDSVRQGIAALKAGQDEQALTAFRQALAANPANEMALLMAADAALNLYRGDAAVEYAEKARQLDPENWKIHTTLVAAYAEAGKRPQRDAERALLRQFHTDPKAKDAEQTSGFLLEMFPVKDYRVEAVEYYKPVEKLHVYYRFLIRDQQRKRVWAIDVESNDFDQSSWAKTYPKQAAEGQRQYQLAGHGKEVNVDYRMFSGNPDYDTIRAMVVKVIEAQTLPFPG